MVGLGTSGVSISDWQRVTLDRPEHLLAALVLLPAAGGADELVGFGA